MTSLERMLKDQREIVSEAQEELDRANEWLHWLESLPKMADEELYRPGKVPYNNWNQVSEELYKLLGRVHYEKLAYAYENVLDFLSAPTGEILRLRYWGPKTYAKLETWVRDNGMEFMN